MSNGSELGLRKGDEVKVGSTAVSITVIKGWGVKILNEQCQKMKKDSERIQGRIDELMKKKR